MPNKLLIIESPAKARTIQKYLGPEFRIMASMGHVKDLPVSKLGVDVQHGFRPEYVTIKGKSKILKELKSAGDHADAIYLAPDPDREGEAIAWHIADELRKGAKDTKKIVRVLFNELTEKAIREAVHSPKDLDRNKFDSQQARRVLDRLVGYQLSPLLWEKVKGGLSAGRVQSVAVKMICEREREIQTFVSQEYWSLSAHLQADEPPAFEARLIKYNDRKADLKHEEDTLRIVSEVQGLTFTVSAITRKEAQKKAPPPFITSLLQQEAFRKLRFSAKKTMTVAQTLYEGVDLGPRGQVGLITYMRTDSFRLSDDAISDARSLIERRFGKAFLPEKPNRFKSRKGAQEAHEAIRPTSAELDPETVAPFLSKDQMALYSLIWKRFMACQMGPAILDKTQADIRAGKALFRANGSILVFPGFTTLYQEALENGDREGDSQLPPLREGQVLTLLKLDPAQHFTQPPPRFTEATLIRELEKNGIGRPSTYATIIANINGKEYVSVEKGQFRPTELGFLVTDLLAANFPVVMDTTFTAQMETNLDRIERGEIGWTDILKEFYGPFERDLKKAEKEMRGEVRTDVPCPKCGRPMAIRSGRNGIFLACTGYPECRSTANFTRDEKGQIILKPSGEKGKEEGVCEKCGRPMVVKNGKYGSFIACSGYPACNHILRPEPTTTGVPCPEKDCQGTLLEKTSKKGKKFYSCSRYPDCTFATWDEPYNEACPDCGTPVLSIKQKKDGATVLVCRNKGCKYQRPFKRT